MKTDKAFKKLVQAKTDDFLLKELKRMRARIGYQKRKNPDMYEYLYEATYALIVYQRYVMRVLR